jgi:cytochrome c oxidase assembly protein subunit 15
MRSDRLSARLYRRLLPAATALALGVIVLGAWVRLTDAGLGCPDWPGCYGTLTVPDSADELAFASETYPERPVETQKAWNEMIHRYFAGALGLMVFAIVASAWANRSDPDQPVGLPTALGVLIVFQALLGMWTVTLLLKPVIVMGHLLGGMSTLGLLFWLSLRAWRGEGRAVMAPALPRIAAIALLAVGVQIALGGWTSTNYAALACPDLPTCQGQWWPEADFDEAFVMWRGLGIDYEGGVLDNPARTAIHLVHRIGAVVVALFVGGLALWALLAGRARPLRVPAALVLGALVLQISIGLGIIKMSLPLWLATSHNAGGALLLLAMLYLNHEVRHVEE